MGATIRVHVAPPDYLQGCWEPSVGVTCPPKARIRASEAHTTALVVCFELWQLQAQGWRQDPRALQQEGQPVPPTPTPSIVHSTQTSHARQSLQLLAPNGCHAHRGRGHAFLACMAWSQLPRARDHDRAESQACERVLPVV